ncbi:sugar phosphate isomerase/epimerase [Gulosibacter sp. 10]|uniref:sugar phosphate isomerase/epimerase family protein n=1 Tax=Gulosibacter sp. 10 TaxID=1255570 RepID=UPI00097ED564|nr:sugar phosphate isomerase/epimerase [Gulosibacter sp. 10]SJM71790.1 Inosose isomerase [Gulosibacter sp. 10]
MQIGINTDGLATLSLDEMLDAVRDLGIEYVELSTGNWSTAPHIDLDELLASERARAELAEKLESRGLKLDAFNCSGNPLHPGPEGGEHRDVTKKTIELAEAFGINRLVLMSGLAGAPGDSHPNWITVAWPPYTADILRYQWDEVLLPYWSELVPFAERHGVDELAIEMHGHQNVYNPETLLRLRDAVGPAVGANFDPSHLMWMGGDVIGAIDELKGAIHHVHAKDVRLEKRFLGRNTALETASFADPEHRSWNFVTMGYGHDETFWTEFMVALRRADFDGILSIEHEDMLIDPIEALEKTVALIKRTGFLKPSAYEATVARFFGAGDGS